MIEKNYVIQDLDANTGRSEEDDVVISHGSMTSVFKG